VASPNPGSASVDAVSLRAGAREARRDEVVVEEPLEIRLDGVPLAVTMRTPGHDVELAAGFLVTEGIARDFAAILSIAHCADDPNTLEVRSEPGAAGIVRPAPRAFAASSACGVCGKATLEEVRARAAPLHGDATRARVEVLCALPARLRAAQPLFQATGALHAAGLFTAEGELLCAREDVGRHNAVDKVVGWAALEGRLPLVGTILLASGRAGFEIAQKALVAGIPILASISGPSSLAVELARENGLTLCAFLRGETCTVYAGAERIKSP
jgi:FdhD protein